MRLLLVRHGESHHTADHRIAERRGCRGLTQRGVGQMQQLAERLRDELPAAPLVSLISSPVRRARHSAEVLAAGLTIPVTRWDENLCEVHPGDADGMTWSEYTQRFGQFDLPRQPTRPFAPHGESWQEFMWRVGTTLDDLAMGDPAKTVIVVTHAAFIVAALLNRFAIPRPGTGARFDPRHASITEWTVRHGVWQLVAFNR